MREDVYDSEAVERDDDDPFVPGGERKRRWRAINWDAFSHALMPMFLRRRAIDVSVTTERPAYDVGEDVLFRVELRNRIPFPVLLPTASSVMWFWSVDGRRNASAVADPEPGGTPRLLRFRRSETKTFTRRWSQQIQVADGEWNAVEPGEYTLAAWINVDDAEEKNLRAETQIEIR